LSCWAEFGNFEGLVWIGREKLSCGWREIFVAVITKIWKKLLTKTGEKFMFDELRQCVGFSENDGAGFMDDELFDQLMNFIAKLEGLKHIVLCVLNLKEIPRKEIQQYMNELDGTDLNKPLLRSLYYKLGGERRN
jgi:hypothetical protein